MSIIEQAKEELVKDLEDKKMQIVKSNLRMIKSLKSQIESLEKLNISIENGEKDEEYSLKERGGDSFFYNPLSISGTN